MRRGAKFRCVLTDEPISDTHIKAETTQAGTIPIAIITEGKRGGLYIAVTDSNRPPNPEISDLWHPEGSIPARLTGGTCYGYGLTAWADIFTPRQLTAMVTLSDLVKEIGIDVRRDAVAAGLSSEDADAYSRTVTTFLALSWTAAATSTTHFVDGVRAIRR